MYNLLITFFLLAILASFLCSLLEAVLLSITPSFAQLKVQEGGRIGQYLDNLKSNIDQPLAAILTLNTIAHTVGAIGVGDQSAKIWADANPMITSVIVPTIMVLGILILSEIIPKTLGANYWQKLTPFTVEALRVIIFLLYPLVWASQHITKALRKDDSEGDFSRSEFLAMAEIGVTEGAVAQHRSEIIGNLLHLESMETRDVLTPRTVVMSASENQAIQAFYDENEAIPFSRIPLYEGDANELVSGYFLKAELMERLVEGRGDEALAGIKREIMVVHESLPLSELFDRFLEKREHIALVVDEIGGMEGIVTMEDVLETLLGLEIVDESDNTEDMQVLARKKWETRARRIALVTEDEDTAEGD
jgi:CBS domain containing-hemolysin-like protein